MDASLPTLSSSSAHPIVFLLKSSLLLELISGSQWPLMCCSLYCLAVGESLCWNRLFLLHGRCCLPPSLCCFILVRLLQAEHQKGAVNWSLPFSADEKIFIQGNAGSQPDRAARKHPTLEHLHVGSCTAWGMGAQLFGLLGHTEWRGII